MSDPVVVPSAPIVTAGNKTSSSTKKDAKKRKKGHAKVKKGRKRGRKSDSQKEEKDQEAVGDSDVDVDEDLKPIGTYIHNRDIMVQHMFRSVSGSKLESLLPDILKDIPLDELKVLCCHQLEGMSKKRIRHVLAGLEMNSSSGTEESNSDSKIDQVEDIEDHTSPDTNAVVHSTCEGQTDGDYRGVGSNNENMPHVDEVNSSASVLGDTSCVQTYPAYDPQSAGEYDEMENGNAREENKEQLGMGEYSYEFEEGSEEGELTTSRQKQDGTAEQMDATIEGPENICGNAHVSGNTKHTVDESEEEGHQEEEEEEEIDGSEDDIPGGLSHPKFPTPNPQTTDSAPGTKPSSELEILELELRARAIRSLMQRVAQNKVNK